MSAIDGQLDLFDELEDLTDDAPPAAPDGYTVRELSEVERLSFGLSTIHVAMSWLLEVVGTLEHKGGPDGSRSPGAVRGTWAYSLGHKGLWFEPFHQWANYDGGRRHPWDTRPAYCLEWDELRDLIGHRPERQEFNEWAHSIPHPHSMWRYSRPWELTANRPHLTDEQLAEGWTYAQAPTDPEVLDRWQRLLAMFPAVIDEVGGGDLDLGVAE